MVSKFEKLLLVCLTVVPIGGCSQTEPEEVDFMVARLELRKKFQTTGELESPVRLEADGVPIDIGLQQAGVKVGSALAHAGPTIADVDGDGDRDLLVGDYPGYFWFFENVNDDDNPSYVAKGKLQAGGEDAETPVY